MLSLSVIPLSRTFTFGAYTGPLRDANFPDLVARKVASLEQAAASHSSVRALQSLAAQHPPSSKATQTPVPLVSLGYGRGPGRKKAGKSFSRAPPGNISSSTSESHGFRKGAGMGNHHDLSELAFSTTAWRCLALGSDGFLGLGLRGLQDSFESFPLCPVLPYPFGYPLWDIVGSSSSRISRL